MPDALQTNNWSQYEKLVLDKLDTLQAGQASHTKAIQALEVSHAVIKAEASRDAKWTSALGAFVGVLISSGIHFTFRGK